MDEKSPFLSDIFDERYRVVVTARMEQSRDTAGTESQGKCHVQQIMAGNKFTITFHRVYDVQFLQYYAHSFANYPELLNDLVVQAVQFTLH